jgi:hypothetical protein
VLVILLAKSVDGLKRAEQGSFSTNSLKFSKEVLNRQVYCLCSRVGVDKARLRVCLCIS